MREALSGLGARLQSEALALFRRKLLWGLLLTAGGLNLFMQGLLYLLASQNVAELPPGALEAVRDSLRWPYGLSNGLGMLGPQALGGVVVIILAGLFVAQEYHWGALAQTVGRGVPRSRWLAGKFILLAVGILLLTVGMLALQGGFSLGFSLATGAPLRADDFSWGKLGLNVLAIAYGLLPYAALAVLAAVALRSSALALGIGIGYTFLVEGLLSTLAASVGAGWERYLLRSLGTALLQPLPGQMQTQAGVSGLPAAAEGAALSPALAAGLIAAYTALFLLLAARLLQRQDL